MPVLTIDEVADHLNVSDTGSDVELMAFAARAEAAVVSRCGPLESTPVTTKVRGYGRSLTPSVTPILSITSVTPTGGSALTLGGLHAPENGRRGPSSIEYLDGSWFGSRWYDVVYNAGRATVPEDLRLALLEAVRFYWETQLGNSPAGALPAGSEPDVVPSQSGADRFPWPRIQHLIEPYEQVWL